MWSPKSSFVLVTLFWTSHQKLIQDGGQPIIFNENISRTKQDMKNR
jgi:hypothetical protein